MALSANPFSELDLNQVEYATTVGTHIVGASTLHVKIPKLMVNASGGRVFSGHNIFLNSPSCPIQVKTTIFASDHITVKCAKTCDLASVSINGIVPPGTLVVCACVTNNIKDIVVIEAIK